jgi:hypothetical protein
MTAKHAKILDQIKKLFSLSKSPNEYEAALALEKAHQLMLKYNIEHQDLAKDHVSDIVEIDFEMTKRYTIPTETLAYHVGQCFFIKPILIKTDKGCQDRLRFIGEVSDISVGTYVFSYLVSLLDTKVKEYLEIYKTKNQDKNLRGKSAKVKKDYSCGFVFALVKKFEEVKKENEKNNIKNNIYTAETCTALVIVKNELIKKYIEEQLGATYPGGPDPEEFNQNHFDAGYKEGDKYGIHRGIQGGNSHVQIGV